MGLYKANITFAWGDWDKFQIMLAKKYGLKKQDRVAGGNAVWLPPKGFKEEEFYLWLPQKLDYGALAHESVHLANYIFESRGIKLDLVNEDEAFSFLVEWLVREYLMTIKDFKKKWKKKRK